MGHNRKTWTVLLGLLAAAALLVSACGDDDDDDGIDAPAPDATGELSSGNEEEPRESATAVGTAAAGDAPDDDGFPLTVERSDGEELVIEEAPQRIVSLDASATEILYAIDAGDQIVAADLYSNFPEEALLKARLDAFAPSPEAILAEEPDLVLIFSNEGDIVSVLDDLGVEVLFLEPPAELDGIMERVELFGEITGHGEEAAAVASDMANRVDSIVEAVSGADEGPRVFHELDNTLFSVGPGSFIGDLYELLGAENVAAAAGQPFPQLTSEAIIAADPEVVILADEAFGETIETVSARPGWAVITAVREGRIHGVDPDIASRPGPRIVEFLELVAAYLYPELFE
ncbi:MAG: ABC transporter substrate-binding protein [Dehalococcoidia bacterium]|nr:ABC transporter substrate-binding protein [Dehalococcoidia bacterium]